MFQYKRFKICVWNRTIGYRFIQCVLGFMVDDCVAMTRNPCENNMFTNSKKAFIISSIFKMKGFWVLQLSIANRQERESVQIMKLLSSKEATNFKARIIALASALKIELADGSRRESTCCPKTAADATLSPSLEIRQYKLQSIQMLPI